MIGADGGKVQVRGQIESGTKGTSAEVTQWGQPADYNSRKHPRKRNKHFLALTGWLEQRKTRTWHLITASKAIKALILTEVFGMSARAIHLKSVPRSKARGGPSGPAAAACVVAGGAPRYQAQDLRGALGE